MEHRKEAPAKFQIKLFLNLPTHYKDFGYEIHHDQLTSGSIILSHYPLEQEEKVILQSVYILFKNSKLNRGSL